MITFLIFLGYFIAILGIFLIFSLIKDWNKKGKL
jgi:hypothetical protein